METESQGENFFAERLQNLCLEEVTIKPGDEEAKKVKSRSVPGVTRQPSSKRPFALFMLVMLTAYFFINL